MSLTLREREHWSHRVNEEIQSHVNCIHAENPGLEATLREQASSEALEDLGVLEQMQELHEIEARQLESQSRLGDLKAEIAGIISNNADPNIPAWRRMQGWSSVQSSITRREDISYNRLLSEDPEGAKIVTLKKLERDLVDRLWQASKRQLKDILADLAKGVGSSTEENVPQTEPVVVT